MHPDKLFNLFGIESMPVYPYGLCLAIGLILCFVFLFVVMWRHNFNDESQYKILIIGVIGAALGILSAMLFQSFYDYLANPSGGFHFSSDMTFLGGLIGGVAGFLIVYWIYIYLIAPRAKGRILSNHMNATLTDALPFIPIAICIAHAFGRLGCFFAGCCYGVETDAWYGLPVKAGSSANVIPTQLFEMIFLVLLVIVMSVLYFRFKFNYNFSVYLMAYGVWRFFIEFLRDDYRGGVEGAALTPSQIISIVMVACGIGYIFLQAYVLDKHMKHPELHKGEEEAEEAEAAEGAETAEVEDSSEK